MPAKEQVLTALGSAISRLRERLGESLRIDPKVRHSPAASDDSVSRSASRILARARRRQGGSARRSDSAPRSGLWSSTRHFAMAQALLSGVLRNTGRSADAPTYTQKAFELRDRVSERERFFISWRYYLDAAQAWDKALDLAATWTRTYPRKRLRSTASGWRRGLRPARACGCRVSRCNPSRPEIRAAVRKSRGLAHSAQPVR